MLLKSLVLIFFTGILTPLCSATTTISLEGKAGKLVIDPVTLAVAIQPNNTSERLVVADAMKPIGSVTHLTVNKTLATWDYSNLALQVSVSLESQGAKFTFVSAKEQTLQWPIAGLSKQAIALIVPDGEGLYLPSHDSFWLKKLSKQSAVSLIMPFWAIQFPHFSVTTILADQDTANTVFIKQKAGQLYLVNRHYFSSREGFPVYQVHLHLTGSSPIDPALDYRNFLIEHNKFHSLRQKILMNANVDKLLGAFHIWLWGNGKNITFLDELSKLGIKRLWLGYDATPNISGFNIDKRYIRKAEKLGYLIAPYDSFDNAQNPANADSLTSRWPNHLWPQGCIRTRNHDILAGFGQRGCYLSARALELREQKENNIAQHVQQLTGSGANSLFLDCDAADPLYEDYSAEHPMTRSQDQVARLSRMNYISYTKKLVLGSETGLSWATPAIAFNNGAFLAFPEGFWPLLKDKKKFGRWWPAEKPTLFFKPYQVSTEFIRASYDPRYRLPLYEAVFHDSVVSTDRWELNELKIPALKSTKALLQNLYNVPPLWVLDQDTFTKNKAYFMAYYHFFSPLHQVAGREALTRFCWLNAAHTIQQTQFGNCLVLTANFSKHPFQDIKAGCIQAKWQEDGSKKIFCPDQ